MVAPRRDRGLVLTTRDGSTVLAPCSYDPTAMVMPPGGGVLRDPALHPHASRRVRPSGCGAASMRRRHDAAPSQGKPSGRGAASMRRRLGGLLAVKTAPRECFADV